MKCPNYARVRWRRADSVLKSNWRQALGTNRAWLVLALLLAGGFAQAQSIPESEPHPGERVRDRDFGVSTRQFGLERQVEMYQWRATDSGYEPVWNGAHIDSSLFAAGHQNPAALPLESRRWWAKAATVDGKRLDPQVLRKLGMWQRFRPNFSRLPANLAASFQPEGDGLGSSENPLAPQVGDVRVHWRELRLPALAGKIELRGDVWVLTPEAATAPVSNPSLVELPDVVELPLRPWWPWLAAGLGMALGLWWLLRWRRNRQTARMM